MEALPELIAGYGRMYPFNKVNEKWIQNNFNVKIPEKTWHFFYKFDDIILMGSENGFFVGVVSDIDTLYNNYTYYFVEDPKILLIQIIQKIILMKYMNGKILLKLVLN